MPAAFACRRSKKLTLPVADEKRAGGEVHVRDVEPRALAAAQAPLWFPS